MPGFETAESVGACGLDLERASPRRYRALRIAQARAKDRSHHAEDRCSTRAQGRRLERGLVEAGERRGVVVTGEKLGTALERATRHGGVALAEIPRERNSGESGRARIVDPRIEQELRGVQPPLDRVDEGQCVRGFE